MIDRTNVDFGRFVPDWTRLEKWKKGRISGIPRFGWKTDKIDLRSSNWTNMEWVKEDTIKNCMRCNVPFTTLRRKHHCRVGGWNAELTFLGLWKSVLWLLFLAAPPNQWCDGTRVQRLFCWRKEYKNGWERMIGRETRPVGVNHKQRIL